MARLGSRISVNRVATTRLTEIREQVDALREAMRIDASDLELPEAVVPVAELNGHPRPPALLDSGWSFAEQCRRLIASKAYREQGDTS